MQIKKNVDISKDAHVFKVVIWNYHFASEGAQNYRYCGNYSMSTHQTFTDCLL